MTYTFTIYANAFRVKDGKWGRVLELMGTPEHLDLATYAHDALRTHGERLWRAHKREHGVTRNTERRDFLLGVMAAMTVGLLVYFHRKGWLGSSET